MTNWTRKLAAMLMILFMAVSGPLVLSGCETEEEPFEETQEAVEDTADEVEDEL